MEYNSCFPRSVCKPSRLGFGCMRFPTRDGAIDMERTRELLDRAYEAGVTYFDTAWVYHGGESESAVGEIMSRHPRETYNLATKLPLFSLQSREEAVEIFEAQLRKLRTDHIDFYLLHCLTADNWAKVLKYDLIPLLEGYQAEGKIINLGFSFHDEYDVFERIATYRQWDFCQIQYNYMDINMQAGDRGYDLVRRLGIPLVIMEPLRGGSLASLPEDVTLPLREYRPEDSTASWGMRWLLSHDNCRVILSGMNDMSQLEDNLGTFDAAERLSFDEIRLVEGVRDTLEKRVFNQCTGCYYCMPCPGGVNIPRNFKIWNEYGRYANKGAAVWQYFSDMPEDSRAHNCLQCGACEAMCPQHISIRDDLMRVTETMNGLKDA